MADGSTLSLDFGHELVVDLFAGGGGASLGLARAYREPDVAVNHDPIAIAVHRANHPTTSHFACDVFEVDPVEATGGQPVGVLWASPDCRHHSKASGGKPRSKRVRGLAWVVVKWAAACRPRIIHLENVEEFADWGPLTADGMPCKVRKGITFRRWVRQLERLGYVVEHRELVAADYGAPTIRKRLYVIARCDGRPIGWPAPTRAKAGSLPGWRSAAECIDFSAPSRSIFDRPRPLKPNTCRRVARGLWRYVLDTATPFIVGRTAPLLTECANSSHPGKVWDVRDPLRTQCAQVKGGHFAMAAASLVTLRQHADGADLALPLRTVAAAGQHHALAAALVTHLTHDGDRRCMSPSEPLATITAANRGEQALVTAWMEQANTGRVGHAASSPLSTIVGRGTTQRLASAYLVRYYRDGGNLGSCADPMHTVPTKDRTGLVTVVHVPVDSVDQDTLARARKVAAFLHEYLPEHFPQPADLVLLGDWLLVDVTLRMLAPRELARAQGFPDSYVLERGLFVDEKAPLGEWRAITKTAQVRLIGNSVCPDVAEALAGANAGDLVRLYAAGAA